MRSSKRMLDSSSTTKMSANVPLPPPDGRHSSAHIPLAHVPAERSASGPDVLVEPEDVVRVPLPLEREEPLVLRVAVDRSRDVASDLRDVVDVPTDRRVRHRRVCCGPRPGTTGVVELTVFPLNLRSGPERSVPTGERGAFLGDVRNGTTPRPDGKAAL